MDEETRLAWAKRGVRVYPLRLALIPLGGWATKIPRDDDESERRRR